jgi:peptide/nickel transport system ATP-binding protein
MNLSVEINELSARSTTGEVTLLNNVFFTMAGNKIYTVLGKNGSGKSTLIKALPALLDVRFYSINGKINYDGKDVLRMNENDLLKFRREKVKVVFQDAVNSYDPLKKLGYYFKIFNIPQSEADDVLNYFLLPQFDKIKEMYPWQLSGGMAQRFSISLGLLQHPELLLLDEPTSGVDVPISNLILNKLKQFVSEKNNTVLLVTQDIDFAKHSSDFIAHIENKTLAPFIPAYEYFASPERLFRK